jgi:hypothetical protein
MRELAHPLERELEHFGFILLWRQKPGEDIA